MLAKTTDRASSVAKYWYVPNGIGAILALSEIKAIAVVPIVLAYFLCRWLGVFSDFTEWPRFSRLVVVVVPAIPLLATVRNILFIEPLATGFFFLLVGLYLLLTLLAGFDLRRKYPYRPGS